ncbi:N-acetylglucosamine kinase [Microbacterium sp. JZ101]
MTVLSIDAGQTGVRARVAGGIVRESPGLRTHEPLPVQLAAAARRAIDEGATEVDAVVVGASGLVDGGADAAALHALLADAGVREVRLAHDSITSYLGALGDVHGAVVAAGTGVVTLAVGPESSCRVDGWGHIMGDAGSGYWIGREALDAVMRAHDGRGPATLLSDDVRTVWRDLETAYILLQSDPSRVSRVASFARAVARRAADGDPVALDISRRAGEQLALSVVAGLRRAGLEGADAPVAPVGGVFGSAPIADAFSAALAGRAPHARIVTARGSGLDGATLLSGVGPGHPLAASVAVVRR